MDTQRIKQNIESLSYRMAEEHPLFTGAARATLTREQLATYLFNLAYTFAHTPGHLKKAAEVAQSRGWTELSSFLEGKINEEIGHDNWAKQDLKSMDAVSHADLRVTAEFTQMMADVSSLIEKDPRLYLSYMAFVEYFTVLVAPELLKNLEKNYGIARHQFSAIANHEEADKEHIKGDLEMMALFANDPKLDDEFFGTIEQSARWVERSLASCVQ